MNRHYIKRSSFLKQWFPKIVNLFCSFFSSSSRRNASNWQKNSGWIPFRVKNILGSSTSSTLNRAFRSSLLWVFFLLSFPLWKQSYMRNLVVIKTKNLVRPCVTNFFCVKALTKRLWKSTIKTKRLSWLKFLSFLNFNY